MSKHIPVNNWHCGKDPPVCWAQFSCMYVSAGFCVSFPMEESHRNHFACLECYNNCKLYEICMQLCLWWHLHGMRSKCRYWHSSVVVGNRAYPTTTLRSCKETCTPCLRPQNQHNLLTSNILQVHAAVNIARAYCDNTGLSIIHIDRLYAQEWTTFDIQHHDGNTIFKAHVKI